MVVPINSGSNGHGSYPYHYEHNCEECGRLFRTNQHLEAHRSRHLDEKPYVCHFAGCDKRYRFMSALMEHMQQNHGYDAIQELKLSAAQKYGGKQLDEVTKNV